MGPFVAIAAIVAIVAIHFFVNSPVTADMSQAVIIITTMGAFVTTMQICAAMGKMSLAWPSSLDGLRSFVALFALDLRLLRGDCALGGDSQAFNFAIRSWFPYSCIAILFAVSFLSRLILKGKEGSSRYFMKMNETLNTCGTGLQAAYITLVLMMIQPFRCYQHPNGKSSVANFQDVLCDGDEHTGMVIVSLIGLAPLVAFLIFYGVCVINIPRDALGNPNFYKSIKFVVYRFHAEAWYWGALFLLRNFLVAMCTLIDPERPFKQTIILMGVLVVYLCVQLAVFPWKRVMINVLDAVQTVCVVLMLTCALTMIGTVDDATLDLAGTIFMTTWIISISSLFAFAFYIGYERWVDRQPHKLRAKQRLVQYEAESIYAQLQLMSEHLLLPADSELHQASAGTAVLTKEKVTNFYTNITEIDRRRFHRMLRMISIELLPHSREYTQSLLNSQSFVNRRTRSYLYNRSEEGEVHNITDAKMNQVIKPGKEENYTTKSAGAA